MCAISIVFYIDLEKESRNHTKTVVFSCSCIFVLQENPTCSVNAVELWRCLQIVIYTEQQIQSLRECLHLYMKVIGPNDTSGITSLVVEVRGFILIGATLTS